jgi:hypothetical protein
MTAKVPKGKGKATREPRESRELEKQSRELEQQSTEALKDRSADQVLRH